jgi:hypothetical protein
MRKNTPENIFNSTIKTPNDCWEWNKTTTIWGYGQAWYHGKRYAAHRLAFLLANGHLPDNMNVCHSCDNRLCINPAHLFLGTHIDNMKDMKEKKRAKNQWTGPDINSPLLRARISHTTK